MKVELDLSTEQLQELDKDLSSLLINMTDEQKIEILKAYLLSQFDNRMYETNYYGNTGLTKFGNAIINGLQNKISESISKEILQDEQLNKVINDTIEYVKKHLSNIIQESITKYFTEKLFLSKDNITAEINQVIDMRRNQETGRLY